MNTVWRDAILFLVAVPVGFVIGFLVAAWERRRRRQRQALTWVPSPHGPVRAPTLEEMEWARLHPGERLPYIPGHVSDPYSSKGKP